MPELPEVETMRRGILSIVGSTINRVDRVTCRLKPIRVYPRIDRFRRLATDGRIQAVDRIGKRVVVRLDNERSIVFEPRMTGLVLVANPPNTEHLRFQIGLKNGPIRDLWYWDRRGLGSVQLLSDQELFDRLGPDKLGPDALLVSANTLKLQFHRSRRAIKIALLDQRAIAGVGNLYASEILHQAGVHPEKLCDRLTSREWKRVHGALHGVLEEAVRYEGSTLSDGTYRNALNSEGSYQHHHRVYDRADELCSSCRCGTVKRIVQAQRSTFFCPRCQRK